jgi:hypothetical protein
MRKIRQYAPLSKALLLGKRPNPKQWQNNTYYYGTNGVYSIPIQIHRNEIILLYISFILNEKITSIKSLNL